MAFSAMHSLGNLDLQSMFRGNLTSSGDNLTVLDNVMETLLPLVGGRKTFALVYQLIGSNYVIAFFAFVWAFQRVFKQVYSFLYGIIQENFMSSVHISSTDEIYVHLMRWLANQPYMSKSRSLMAETVSKTAWEEEDDLQSLYSTSTTADGRRYLNFSNQEAKAPPRFVPALGVHGFWFQGKYYRLHRKQQSLFEDGSGFQTFKDKEDLVLSCFGRNPTPIKLLLQHAKERYYSDQRQRTTIRRPAPQSIRRYGGRYTWQQVASRPARPMRTVVLDATQKSQVLDDMNEYLHPATPRWYATRGIPLRRGYLFHGPPGTGKTSLSFALAGVFGLDIYVISLLEPTLTEEDLCGLFQSLPRRCVVLLEDIDTAGLRRNVDDEGDKEEEGKADKSEENKGGKQGKKRDGSAKEDWKVADLARALKKEGADDKKGISLSGLLNAIDGVASHEGRVLIMTTNKPESLDEALIRPGRVDLQVGFVNATKEQAAELFERMYEGGATHPLHVSKLAEDASSSDSEGSVVEEETGSPLLDANGKANGKANGDASTLSHELEKGGLEYTSDVTSAELKLIAAEFGEKIPDSTFSPAEIQGFLLKRKLDPRRALSDTDAWMASLVKQKELKKKVMVVQ